MESQTKDNGNVEVEEDAVPNENGGVVPVQENNGLVLNGVFMPPEVLETILSFCDLTSLKWIRLVCSQWNCVTQQDCFIRAMYDRHGVPWSSIPDHIKSSDSSAALLHAALRKNCFRDNMILNPSGENGLQHWKIPRIPFLPASVEYDGINTESPPLGCDALPTLPNSCFATSYFVFRMSQSFDFGLSSEIVNLLTPFEVRFSVMTAAEAGSVGVGKLAVLERENMLNNGHKVGGSLTFRMPIGRTHWIKRSFAVYFPAGKKYASPQFTVLFEGRDTKFSGPHFGFKCSHFEAVLKPLSPEEVDNPHPEYPRVTIEGISAEESKLNDA